MSINPTDDSRNELMTSREASELLPRTGVQTLLRWAKQGKVPFVELPSGRKFFRRSDIEALLTPVSSPSASSAAE